MRGCPLTHALLARAVALVAPAEAVFGGLTAASWWSMRGPLAGPDDPVEVLLPPNVRWNAGPGVLVRTATTSDDVATDGVLRYTDRTRTALDLIRRGPSTMPLSCSTASSTTERRSSRTCARRPTGYRVAVGALRHVRSPRSLTAWPSPRPRPGCGC